MLSLIYRFLPACLIKEIKKYKYIFEIYFSRFKTLEPEVEYLSEWIKEGDWVLDIGANVGHYTFEFSTLVGEKGRVISFEPIPLTFQFLSSNASIFEYSNTTLINTAVSRESKIIGMEIPENRYGIDNLYRSHIKEGKADLAVMAITIDSLKITEKVSLVKIDVEGHELEALQGMKNLIARDTPVLIIEGESEKITEFLKQYGYTYKSLNKSPNRIYSPIQSVS